MLLVTEERKLALPVEVVDGSHGRMDWVHWAAFHLLVARWSVQETDVRGEKIRYQRREMRSCYIGDV